jgi:hypothetical protein
MAVRRITDRAAGVVVALVGLFLLASALATLARALPDVASESEVVRWMIGAPELAGGLVLGIVAVLGVVLAGELWDGGSAARATAAALVVVAGVIASFAATGFGSVLWALRILVVDPEAWLVRWPYFYWNPFLGTDVVGTPVESLPYGRLDDPYFWLPGILAGGALLVGGLFVIGWIAGHVRGARPA